MKARDTADPADSSQLIARRVEELSRVHVNEALRALGKAEYEIGDSQVPGLCLRVRKRSVTWNLRGRLAGKQSTWLIGDAAGLTAVSKVRERALEAKNLLKRGVDPTTFLDNARLGGPVVVTPAPEAAPIPNTWELVRERYLVYVKATLAVATYNDYRKVLSSSRLSGFQGRDIAAISRTDIVQLRDSIVDAGHTTEAKHFVRVLSAFFGWAETQVPPLIETNPTVMPKIRGGRRGRSGPAASEPETKPKRKPYLPKPEQLGRCLKQIHTTVVETETRLALLILHHTAQRRESIASAYVGDFAPWPLREGAGLWTISHRKSVDDFDHALPIVPSLWTLIEARCRLIGDPNAHLFPQTRATAGTTDRNGHRAPGGLLNKPMIALSAGYSPHDVRRALTTYGQDVLGYQRDLCIDILDHTDGRKGGGSAGSYDWAKHLDKKYEFLMAWEELLDRLRKQS